MPELYDTHAFDRQRAIERVLEVRPEMSEEEAKLLVQVVIDAYERAGLDLKELCE